MNELSDAGASSAAFLADLLLDFRLFCFFSFLIVLFLFQFLVFFPLYLYLCLLLLLFCVPCNPFSCSFLFGFVSVFLFMWLSSFLSRCRIVGVTCYFPRRAVCDRPSRYRPPYHQPPPDTFANSMAWTWRWPSTTTIMKSSSCCTIRSRCDPHPPHVNAPPLILWKSSASYNGFLLGAGVFFFLSG